MNEDIPYFKIQNNQYWIDDINSKFYNQLIMLDKKPKISGEHLIDFANEDYEYAIEIKVNPHNFIGKGSAIMLHCNKNEYTYGCVGILRGGYAVDITRPVYLEINLNNLQYNIEQIQNKVGKKVPIIGKVCMDSFMVDVTDIEDVYIKQVV